jgi:two-component system cell cycle response regulator
MEASWTALLVLPPARDAAVVRGALESAGARVLLAHSTMDALQQLIDQPCELAVVDDALDGERGRAVLEALREGGGRTPVLMLTSGASSERVALLDAGADDVLAPDAPPAELTARVRRRRDTFLHQRGLAAEAARLHALSVTDGLTELANRRHFQDRLHEEFRRAQRYDDPLSLMLVDLDHFKAVNDTHGHQLGDEVLRAVAACLREAVRETDFVARYGGEEFAVILPKTHLGGALTVAERISAEVRRLRLGVDRSLTVTASLGVSSYPSRAVTTPEQLVRTTDQALYRAKSEGRNRINLHSPPPGGVDLLQPGSAPPRPTA